MPHLWCKGAALSVQGCCHYRCQGAALFLALLEAAVFREFTHDVSITMVYCRYTYAGLLVPDSWTFGTRQLDFSGTIILKSLQLLFCLTLKVVS